MKFNTFGTAMSSILLAAASAFALPKAATLVEPMGMGFNIGNTMEVPENPTAWGNPLPTASYIKAIKAAGFNTVRIPCAWYSHSDALAKDIAANGGKNDNSSYTHVGKDASFTTPTIDAAWLKQVKDVVDMVIAEKMYVVLNSHWDEGWLEDRVYDGVASPRGGANNISNSSATTKARQAAYWKQIATYFKDYDEHLLFAGANEPGVNDPWDNGKQWAFDDARMQILKGYYEAFITSVRSAGGNNDTRTLIVQAPRTEMDNAPMLSKNWPNDPAGAGYMMAEVHYYPYQYSLMTADESWGNQFYYYSGLESKTDAAHNMTASGLGTPNQIEKSFGELKTTFCDKGIPVIIGELGAIKRLDQITDPANLKLHLQGRALFYGNVAKNAKANGIIPYVWDTGAENDGNMTIITRQKGTNEILDPDVLNAMRKAYGMSSDLSSNLDSLLNENIIPESTEGNGLLATYKTKTTDSSETGTIRLNLNGKDLSGYTGVTIRMKGSITSAGGCTNPEKDCSEYGWTSMDLFMMDGAWKWFDGTLIEQADVSLSSTKFQDFTLNFADLRDVPTDMKMNALGINLYGTQVTGQILFDYILLNKADGTADTLTNFNTKPTMEGIVTGKIAPLNTAISGTGTTAIKTSITSLNKMKVSVTGSLMNVSFVAKTGTAEISLMNSLGQTLMKKSMDTKAGTNEIQIDTGFHGPVLLMIRQNSQLWKTRVNLK